MFMEVTHIKEDLVVHFLSREDKKASLDVCLSLVKYTSHELPVGGSKVSVYFDSLPNGQHYIEMIFFLMSIEYDRILIC